MIKNRLNKNYKRLKSQGVPAQTDAYRLYDMDIPEYPFMVDIYQNYAVVHDKTNPKVDAKKNQLEEILHALNSLMPNLMDIFIKHRKNQERFNKYKRIGDAKKEFFVRENNALYKVNLSDYIDTGLFLDHRPLRKWITQKSKNKTVLNLFSYTCSISTASALGGASSVTSIDLSQNYLNWGMENFSENKIPVDSHRFIQGNVIDILPKLNDDSFDIIICDPPTFSNSKKMEKYFDVQKEHVFLINQCMKKLSRGGELFFSCNKRDFTMSEIILNNGNYELLNLSLKSIPSDFRNSKIHQCYSLRHKPNLD